jgi:hypothetical protein
LFSTDFHQDLPARIFFIIGELLPFPIKNEYETNEPEYASMPLLQFIVLLQFLSASPLMLPLASRILPGSLEVIEISLLDFKVFLGDLKVGFFIAAVIFFSIIFLHGFMTSKELEVIITDFSLEGLNIFELAVLES